VIEEQAHFPSETAAITLVNVNVHQVQLIQLQPVHSVPTLLTALLVKLKLNILKHLNHAAKIFPYHLNVFKYQLMSSLVIRWEYLKKMKSQYLHMSNWLIYKDGISKNIRKYFLAVRLLYQNKNVNYCPP